MKWIEAIFGALTPSHGVPSSTVDEAERRLGLRLPEALKGYYLLTGQHRPLHAVHNRLVELPRIDCVADHLVFYEENQEVVVWGIARERLSEADPPVEQGQVDAAGVWTFRPEFRSVSEFACAQAAWQAVQGGLPFVGVRESDGESPTPRTRLPPPELSTEGLDAWLLPEGVCVLADTFVGLAARTADAFLSCSARLGIEVGDWDYSSLEDDDGFDA